MLFVSLCYGFCNFNDILSLFLFVRHFSVWFFISCSIWLNHHFSYIFSDIRLHSVNSCQMFTVSHIKGCLIKSRVGNKLMQIDCLGFNIPERGLVLILVLTLLEEALILWLIRKLLIIERHWWWVTEWFLQYYVKLVKLKCTYRNGEFLES